jgi:hypothetical protein
MIKTMVTRISSRVKKTLVTGSSGLTGSGAIEHFDHKGHQVFGGDQGGTK